MKLSKVKKVVLNHQKLCVARANTGIDVQTWVGVDMAMYPVHELVITPMLAARIWELSEKQIHLLDISEHLEGNYSLIITESDLEGIPMLAEAENGEPNLTRICQIDGNIFLLNQETGQAYYFSAELLGPVEGSRIQYFAEPGKNIIGVYSDGKLEAAIYGGDWRNSEYMTEKQGTIAKIWEAGINQ